MCLTYTLMWLTFLKILPGKWLSYVFPVISTILYFINSFLNHYPDGSKGGWVRHFAKVLRIDYCSNATINASLYDAKKIFVDSSTSNLWYQNVAATHLVSLCISSEKCVWPDFFAEKNFCTFIRGTFIFTLSQVGAQFVNLILS